jgi:hypothetical protein
MGVETPEVIEVERAGRRSGHGSSADAWEERERSAAISRALAVLPEEMQRRLQNPNTVISPLVVAERAKEMEAAYQALCAAILTEDDFALYEVKHQRQVNGAIREVTTIEKRKRKSAWRKIARYFNIDVEILREVIGHQHAEATCSRIVMAKHGIPMAEGEDCACPTGYARYHVKITAWNGRVGFGVGIASRNERAFKAQDHSLPATAWTRALSRAISDLVGAGEGEAGDPVETADAPRGEPTARPAQGERAPLTNDQVRAYTDAWRAGADDLRRQVRDFLKDEGYEGNFVTTGAADYQRVMEILGATSPESVPQ